MAHKIFSFILLISWSPHKKNEHLQKNSKKKDDKK